MNLIIKFILVKNVKWTDITDKWPKLYYHSTNHIWHLVFTEGNGLYRNIQNYSYGYKETKKYLKLRHKLTHYAMSLKPKNKIK